MNRFGPIDALDGLTLKQLKDKSLSNWHWFVLFSLMGVGLAVIYHKLIPQKYQISSTILIKGDNKTTDLNNIFSNLNVRNNNPVIQDQVGVLKSYSLNFRTMQYFDWKHSWYKLGFFDALDLYKNDPFEVKQPAEAIQTENIPLIIEPLSEDLYQITCDAEVKVNGAKVKVEINKKVKFGENFKNDYFNFTLDKIAGKPVQVGESFKLVFNNISQLALSYKERLEVTPANDGEMESNLIVLQLVTSDLERDVDYLNQLGKIYIQFGLDEKNKIANNTIKFIDDQITGVNQSLQVAGDQFTNFRARNRTVDLGQEASVVVEKLKQIETERSNLELKLEYYNNLKFYLDNRDQNKDLVAPSLVGVTDDALNSKVLKLNELYTQREVLSYTAQERNPVLINLNQQISYTQKSLKENVDNLISNTNVEIQNLNQRQGSVNSEMSRLPKTEQDLIGIKRNFDLNNELYTFLLQRRAEAEIAKASNNPDAQILDPTDKQIALPKGPGLVIKLVIGIFFGLFVSLGLVVFQAMFSEKLTDVDEIAARLNVSLVGSLAHNRYKTETPVLEHPRSALTESYRGLRLNLEHMMEETKGKVLSVHSYISGEGKSFVTVNLALVFAMNSKKVLVIDSDLRKPRLHKVFDLQNDIGLSTFLEGKADWNEVVKETKNKNLSFVPSGNVEVNAAELLNNGMLKGFLDKAREKFDVVLIDNSPYGVVYDPIMVGFNADFNLVLIRLNESSKIEIDEINKVSKEGILKRVVVAVNGIKQKAGYGYYTDDSKSKPLSGMFKKS